MEPKYEIGDKVWYRTILAGTIKGKIIARAKTVYGGWNYIIKTTSRKNVIFPYGCTFVPSELHMWKR